MTTRYQELHEAPEAMTRLRKEVRNLLRDCRRNTLFLFPSYGLLESFLDLRRERRVPVFVERSARRGGSTGSWRPRRGAASNA